MKTPYCLLFQSCIFFISLPRSFTVWPCRPADMPFCSDTCNMGQRGPVFPNSPDAHRVSCRLLHTAHAPPHRALAPPHTAHAPPHRPDAPPHRALAPPHTADAPPHTADDPSLTTPSLPSWIQSNPLEIVMITYKSRSICDFSLLCN